MRKSRRLGRIIWSAKRRWLKIKLNTIFKVEVQRQAKSSWPLIKRPRAFYILFWNIKEGTMVEKKTCISQIRWWRRWARQQSTALFTRKDVWHRWVRLVSVKFILKISCPMVWCWKNRMTLILESIMWLASIHGVHRGWYYATVLYAKEILNSIGASQSVTDRERAQIALSYHWLSLLDVFWVKEENETVRF